MEGRRGGGAPGGKLFSTDGREGAVEEVMGGPMPEWQKDGKI